MQLYVLSAPWLFELAAARHWWEVPSKYIVHQDSAPRRFVPARWTYGVFEQKEQKWQHWWWFIEGEPWEPAKIKLLAVRPLSEAATSLPEYYSLTASLHQEQLMATISLLWKENFCWKP